MTTLAWPPRLRQRVFYGWWIVLACGCLQILGSGFFYYGLSTFFLPLTREFGWSRALTSSAFSLHRLEGGVIAPIVGFTFDRLGPRKLIAFGVTLAGAGFVILSQVNSFAGFALSVLITSAGFSCGFGAVGMASVANWFVRKRTIALGLLMAGAGAGGLLVPVLAWLIETYGWRTAALAVGLVMWLFGWPLSRVVRHRPELYGLLPDDDQPASATPKQGVSISQGPAARGTEVAEVSLGVAQALRTRAFWLLALSTSLTMVAQSALVVHAIPYLAGVGIPSTLAATTIAAMTVISVAGRIGFGWLGDRLQKRHVMALLLGLQVGGLGIFASISEPWHLIPFLALYAPSYGGAIPLRPSIQGEYFGRRSFGSIQGVMMGCTSFGGVLGPVFAGWMFDLSGSYRLAFWILAAIVASAVPAVLALPLPPKGTA